MLLARRGDEPFEESEATELRAVAYRIALAIENGLLHKGMTDQLAQLHRLQQLTAVLAGTLELDAVGQRVADTLVSEAAVSSSVVLIDRSGELVVLSRAGVPGELVIKADELGTSLLDDRWKSFPLEVADKTVGVVAVTGAPAVGSEEHQLLLHLVSLGALSLDKALLHEQSREQARHDSLTGLLGHRVFHEVLEQQIAAASPFSVLLFDIDDFKQINDLHGHQTGDHALRLVAEALRQGTRSGDSVFRIGGEEFCALLPGLTEKDAFSVAEGVRQKVAAILSTLPNPVTVSVGVASFPAHGQRRDELLSIADAALYASKRGGKNRTSVPGGEEPRNLAPSRREVGLDLLHQKDPDTVSHSVHVAILTVEIARALGLDDVRLDDLRTAARLHDIGKLARAGLDPEQGRRARRGRVPHHQDAPGGRRRAAAELGARRARHHRPAASRADRRLRLSVRASRRRDPPREPDRARRRRVRRDDARPAVSQGDAAGGGVRRARAPQRHAVRSRRRRGADRHRACAPLGHARRDSHRAPEHRGRPAARCLTLRQAAATYRGGMADLGWQVRAGRLWVEDVACSDLAARFGTPLYVISEARLRENARRLQAALAQAWPLGAVRVLASLKANPTLATRAILSEEGLGCDTFGETELVAALRAGVRPELISVNGASKSERLIRLAVGAGARITLDSARELPLVEAAAAAAGVRSRVRIRLRPRLAGLDAPSELSHDGTSIRDAFQSYKAGVPIDDAVDLGRAARRSRRVELVGLHVHLARQTTDTALWAAQIESFVDLVGELSDGLGRVGSAGDRRRGRLAVVARPGRVGARRPAGEDRDPHDAAVYAGQVASTLAAALARRGLARPGMILEAEPGRAIYADAGLHLATVTNVKQQHDPQPHRWVETDTSEVFLFDTTLESALFPVVAVERPDAPSAGRVDVTGISCNFDLIAPDVDLPEVGVGDILAFLETGAYQEASAANFNGLPRPATVLVSGSAADVIKRRETVDEVLARDLVPARLARHDTGTVG